MLCPQNQSSTNARSTWESTEGELWLLLFLHDPVFVSMILISLNCCEYELLQQNPAKGRSNGHNKHFWG